MVLKLLKVVLEPGSDLELQPLMLVLDLKLKPMKLKLALELQSLKHLNISHHVKSLLVLKFVS